MPWIKTDHAKAYVSDSFHVTDVFVKAKHRRKGHGRELMSRIIRDAEEQGAIQLTLYVEPDNVPAIRLYESLGFVHRPDSNLPGSLGAMYMTMPIAARVQTRRQGEPMGNFTPGAAVIVDDDPTATATVVHAGYHAHVLRQGDDHLYVSADRVSLAHV